MRGELGWHSRDVRSGGQKIGSEEIRAGQCKKAPKYFFTVRNGAGASFYEKLPRIFLGGKVKIRKVPAEFPVRILSWHELDVAPGTDQINREAILRKIARAFSRNMLGKIKLLKHFKRWKESEQAVSLFSKRKRMAREYAEERDAR